MTLRARATLAFLVAALVLGGSSSGGLWANLLVQMLGGALIAWTWPATPRLDPLLRGALIAFALFAALQFLPLPPSVWPHLPGREAVAAGFPAIGTPLSWQSWSLSPWDSLSSLAGIIPAVALYLGLRADDAPAPAAVALTTIAAALVSLPLSLVQRFAGKFYLYTITNYGLGPGFFANGNHQGDLLLVALAFGAGMLATRVRGDWFKLTALGLALVAGIAINRSLAGLALLPLEIALLAIVFAPPRARPIAFGALAATALLIVLLLAWPGSNDLIGGTREPGISRRDFLAHGLPMLRATFPVGSGLGTFADLYRWYEDHRIADGTFANHAHDDLLEWLIETGVLGIAVLALGVAWLGRCALRLARADAPGIPAAAGIAILVLLLHSLVDYPLRTAAVSGLFAVCCALLERGAAGRDTTA